MRRSPLLVIFFTVLLDLIGFGIIIPLMPLYGVHLGANGKMIALLMASYSLMQLIFAPVWGRLSDRYGRRPLLLMSILGNCVALLVFGLGSTYASLLIARLFAGICTANITVANAYVADVTTPENRAKGMGMVGAAFGLGFVLGPMLGGVLSDAASDGTLWGLSLGFLGLDAAALRYAAPPLFAALLALLNFMMAYWALPESLSASDRARARSSIWEERVDILRSVDGLVGLVTLVFLQIFAFSMLEFAFALFANVRLGFGTSECSYVFAFIGVVMVIVQGGLLGRFARRFGEARLVMTGLAMTAVGMLLLPLTPGDGVAALYLFTAVFAAGQALAAPSLSSLLSRRSPLTRQGAVLGLSQSASALARTTGPAVAGLLYDWQSPATPFVAGGIVMVVALLIGRMVLRSALNGPRAETESSTSHGSDSNRGSGSGMGPGSGSGIGGADSGSTSAAGTDTGLGVAPAAAEQCGAPVGAPTANVQARAPAQISASASASR